MKTRLLGLCSICIVLVSLVACGEDDSQSTGSGDAQPVAGADAQPAASLQVVDQREIQVPQARILSLSPDGQWMVVDKLGKHLCVIQAASGAEQSCTLSEDLRQINPSSVSWSPDSRSIALTEYATKYMVESDVWVMEVESGKLSNLTDDGVTGNLLSAVSGEDEVWVDLAPGWSPDGKQLIFARSTHKGDKQPGTELYRVSAKGGSAKKLLAATPEDQMTVWHGLSWSGAAKSIVYSVSHNRLDYPGNGIWIAEEDGDNAQRLMSPDPDLGPVILIEVSALVD